MTNQIFAQTENYKATIDQFQTKYNAGKYDDIFNSFSIEMKQALPLESTKEFLTSLKSQVGKIENKEFIKYEKETYASYKTKFEKAVLSVNISLNENNQINGLFVKPFEESATSEAKNTVNVLSKYPKEIAQIIYSKSKDFPNKTQLSIAVIKNGKTNYYGIIKQNDSIKPIENQSKVFEIGSITKVFTSTVLASLVEDKKINLANHVNNYYPFTFKDNINISFESLANHTSGLPRLPENLDLSNESNPYKNYGKKELEDYLKNTLTLENKSSKSYAYSNLGAGLLFILFIGFIHAQKLTSTEISLINQGDIKTALPIFQTTDSHQHTTLLDQSKEINPTDPNTAILVSRMKESLLSTDGGVGIAAPQVGINRKVIWVQRFDKQGEPLEYFINPVITWRSELQNLGPEGDLSIPEFRGQFYRSKVIQLQYVDLKGQKFTEIVEGFTAVIFQHEIDHLFGVLISDKKEKEINDEYIKVDAYKRSDSVTR